VRQGQGDHSRGGRSSPWRGLPSVAVAAPYRPGREPPIRLEASSGPQSQAKYRGKPQGRPAGTNHCKFLIRTREYLTTAEIERLMAAARKSSRYGHRDATMILIGYRHGLRASELCNLQWSQVELTTGRLHVRRAKNGSPSVHPMQGDEIRALRRLQREQGLSSHVFMSERDGPMTPKAFHALFGRIGSRAKMQFPIHPHMLRHGCGYALANAGHDTRALQAWLGHRNIQHTVRYTELAPDRFKNFWRD
jgi:integrase